MLTVSSPLVIGSETAKTAGLKMSLRVRPAPGFAGPLVRLVNLGNCEIDIALDLTAPFTGDAFWVESVNGLGNFDNLYHLYSPTDYTVNGSCLTLACGSGNTPSVAADFFNGNTFERCNLAANGPNGRCVVLRPTAQWLPGSVSGVIARDLFQRCDWNSYDIDGGGLWAPNPGNISYLEFVMCTFEGTAPNYDIDLSVAPIPGQFFRHPRATHPKAAQQGLQHSLWVDDESATAA